MLADRAEPHEPASQTGFILAAAFAVWSYYHWAPLWSELERPRPGEEVPLYQSIEAREAVEREYQQDVKDADEEERRVEAINSPTRKPWRCLNCGEENPATFDMCWKCQWPQAPQ